MDVPKVWEPPLHDKLCQDWFCPVCSCRWFLSQPMKKKFIFNYKVLSTKRFRCSKEFWSNLICFNYKESKIILKILTNWCVINQCVHFISMDLFGPFIIYKSKFYRKDHQYPQLSHMRFASRGVLSRCYTVVVFKVQTLASALRFSWCILDKLSG